MVFLAVAASLRPLATYADTEVSITVIIALLVALIPTTIGALLSAIGIAGMDRLVQRNVLAMSGRAVEAAGDVDTLLLDKTGTITLGNRQASEFIPAEGVSERELAEAAQLSSLADETPEGRSIVVLAKERFGLRERDELLGPRVRALQRGDPHERRPHQRLGHPQGGRRLHRDLGGGAQRVGAARASRPTSSASPARAARRSWWPATRRPSA